MSGGKEDLCVVWWCVWEAMCREVNVLLSGEEKNHKRGCN